ncbi:MAG: thioesterase II family protein [Suipraeoptans sp.]
MEKIKLIALPCAGASAMMYKQWNSLIDENIEIVPIEMPGRGLRFKDKVAENMEELKADIMPQILPIIEDGNYALIGFCFGASVIYDIYRTLKLEGYKLPKYIIIGSSSVPGVHIKSEKLFQMSNIKIVWALIGAFSFNVISANNEEQNLIKALLSMINPDVKEKYEKMSVLDLIIGFLWSRSWQSKYCQTVLRILKADGKILYQYDCNADEVHIEVPMLLIHGKDDNLISLPDMEHWQDISDNEFNLVEVKGGHMMVFDYYEEVVSLINSKLSLEVRM